MRHVPKLLTVIVLTTSMCAQNVDLDALLAKTTDHASAYVSRISRVRCTEEVTQNKVGEDGRAEYAQSAASDYYLVVHDDQDDFNVLEMRQPLATEPSHKKSLPLLLTNGFSTLFLVFHPHYRNSYTFSLETPDVIDGTPYERVRFRHIPGTRAPAVLAVRGREFPLQFTGVAWIDPATGALVRIDAVLQNDMSDVGVRSLKARIDYAPVRLTGWPAGYLFPALATIELETKQNHWRNVHRFNDYKRFAVSTKIQFDPEVKE